MNRSVFVSFVMICLVLTAMTVQAEVALNLDPNDGVPVSAETKAAPTTIGERGETMSAVLVARNDSGLEFRVTDQSVAAIEVQVYDVASDALVWSSSKINGSQVVWEADIAAGQSLRFSVKGWDQNEVLVTHQVTTKILTPIQDISFDNIPTNTKIFGVNDIDLDGDTIVTGDVTVNHDGSSNALRIASAMTGAGTLFELIELEAAGTTTNASFIEFQNSGIKAQIQVDGSAWFQNSTQRLPAFLPIAFGYVEANGSVASSSGNVTCVWNAALLRYEISIPGHTYWYNNYSTMVTPGSSWARTRTSSVGGDLLVYIQNTSGSGIQHSFQFVSYFNPVDYVAEESPLGVDTDDAP